MKRFILAMLFLSLFGFSSNGGASFNPTPRSLPFTENGVIYTDTFSYNITEGGQNTTWNFYTTGKDLFTVTQGECYGGYGCVLYFYTSGTGGSFQFAYETFSDGSLIYDYWGYTQYNNSAQLFYSTNCILSYENQVAFSGDIYDSTGASVIFPANWEGSGFITMDLNVSNSPELGGGVIITPPLGLPYSHCGVNGESECELLDLDYNSQVTLEVQANSGYAFSHWVINNQTMGDVDGTIVIPMSEDKNVVAVFNCLECSPIRPVNGVIELDYDVDVSWRVDNHNGIDYDSDLNNPVKSVGKGIVHDYTKVDASSFGALEPDRNGPAIWIEHRLSTGEPIYVLYGHTASSWNDQSTGSGGSFVFNCTYAINISGVVDAGSIIGYTAPFYHSGGAQPHLHLSVFKPYQKTDGTYYGPPNSGWGYSDLILPTGEFINPEIFFANYYLTDNLE